LVSFPPGRGFFRRALIFAFLKISVNQSPRISVLLGAKEIQTEVRTMQTDVIAIVAVFGTISFITWTIFSSVRKLRLARVQADVQTILLSRFDSAQNMASYIQTDAGKQFLNGIRFEHETPLGPMLACVRWGIVIMFLGAALCILRAMGAVDSDTIVPGVLALALGFAFEVAAFASWYLYRALGLTEPASRS
jgi:hypothetical protein